MSDGERTTILLVEDDAILALAGKDRLEQAGYAVLTASRGEAAVELATGRPEVALVLMDIDLGHGMDGAEAARRIIAQRDVPVLFLSSHTEPEVVERTEQISSYGYVVKDSGEVVLEASIRMAFRLHAEKLRVQDRQRKIEEINRVLEESIAERIQAEAVAREQMDLRTRVFNSLDARLAVVDGDGIIQEVNDSWRRFALENGGVDESTWGVGADYFRKVSPAAGDMTCALRAYDGVRRVQRGEIPFFEVEYPCHSPSVKRWFIMRAVPLAGREGSVLVSHTDVTVARLTEEALRASREMLAHTQAIGHTGSWELDVLENRLTWSDETYRIFGLRPQESTPSYDWFLSMVHPDDRERIDAAYTASVRERQDVYEIEHRIVRPGTGEVRYVFEKSIHVKDMTGAIVRSLGLVDDITEWKKAQQERENALAIVQQQLREKEVLLRETHHRIKNNIASIGHLLSLQAGTVDSPEAVRALQDATARVTGMRVLYDRMLRADEYSAAAADLYLSELVDSSVAIFAGTGQATVRKELQHFRLDPRRLFPLGIIVNELVTNAMKYAFAERAGGVLRVAVAREGDRMILTIADDGPGLPPGFDFRTAEGFGIMLVRMLCEQIDAEPVVESSRRGVRWTISFAVTDEAEGPSPAKGG